MSAGDRSARDGVLDPPRTAPAAAADLPHDCAPAQPGDVSGSPASTAPVQRGNPRLVGIDAARGLALFGMMAIHVMDPVGPDGGPSLTWDVAAGRSAALFALLAGVGVAFATGRRRPPAGRAWGAHAASLAVRALLVGAVGLLLGPLVSRSLAGVILPYYALLFVLAIPLLLLSVRALLVTAAAVAIGLPVLSHLLRAGEQLVTEPNYGFADLVGEPGRVFRDLLLTGTYPALPWLAYLCVGLAVGRSLLSSRRVVALLVVVGVGLAVGARLVSWSLLDVLGGRADLQAAALAARTPEEYRDLLLWGPAGTTPTETAWWLATAAPHSTTPLDLLSTIGVGLAVLGVCILVGRTTTRALRPLSAAGSMTLSLYCLHLLLLGSGTMPRDDLVSLLVQVLLVVGSALLWSRSHVRGPLEEIVAQATGAVRRRVLQAGAGTGAARS
ncbi:Uncharacterized membrane protein YeiB [Geodermatophilus pulveris]|uniref:Uncharacterized membrane protein YeiB n=1 Tax=Geodermatophilus pulveris TaxID=1564159 RepID=A0A239J795_9ACTN|nr:heparan-alpha-glucosaminide N-acetyltransferase domain-containing protein [Geodermatophilus pulveris]SNT01358.1 Uncharacterized membrane protein YeiB [Geodermatophilus pulveris]